MNLDELSAMCLLLVATLFRPPINDLLRLYTNVVHRYFCYLLSELSFDCVFAGFNILLILC